MANCAQYDELRDAWTHGEFIHGFVCTYGPDPALQLVFATIVFGTIGVGLFITTGSVIVPAVLAILLAGAVFVFLPPGIVQFALIIALFVVAIGGYLTAKGMGR